jgi:hypothetical protein
MQVLFYLSRLVLLLVLLGIAWAFFEEYKPAVWSFFLLGAWAAHLKSAPLGGGELFFPSLRHTEIAILLGLLGVLLALRNHRTAFWFVCGLAALVHFLVGAQFVLVFGLPYLYRDRREWRSHLAGISLLAGSLVIYAAYFSPEPFDLFEARIFLETKGNINHISLLNQQPFGWVKFFGVTAVTLLAAFHFQRSRSSQHRDNLKMLAVVILWGTCVGLAISLFTTFFQVPEFYRLAQFQPVRIFNWVWLFTHLLLVFLAGALLARNRQTTESGLVLLLLCSLIWTEILGSLWVIWLSFLGIIYFLAVEFIPHKAPGKSQADQEDFSKMGEKALKTALIVTGTFMVFFWVMGDRLPFESLQDPVLALLGAIFIFAPVLRYYWKQYYPYLVGFMLVASLVSASIYTRSYFAARADPDWDTLRDWARSNTHKSDLFLNASQAGNFRTRALRSSVGELESAVAWVDPHQYLRNSEHHQSLQQGFDGGNWDLDYLFNLAKNWGAEYIILDKPISTLSHDPVFFSGDYQIIAVP